MKLLILVVFPFLILADFMPNKSCKKCHQMIYQEYQKARHSHSSIFKDPIHNAVWKLSLDFKNKQYRCAICHTPSDTKLLTAIFDYNSTMMPDINSTAQKDGVSCAYCHRIKKIKRDDKFNHNIISAKEKIYFGNRFNIKKITQFHQYASNENFQNGNVCLGCHSHFKNKYGINICSYDKDDEMKILNCVSCHMPKVKGSVSDEDNSTKFHAFHGFAGIYNKPSYLNKYIGIEILRGLDRFFIAINNKAPHPLTLHPMRVMQLRVSVIRDNNTTIFPVKNFVRIIGKKDKITLPWNAKEIIKNTSIKSNEKRISTYMFRLKPNDIVNIKVGYKLLSKELAKKLGLDNNKEIERFILLKEKTFIIKPDNFEPQVK